MPCLPLGMALGREAKTITLQSKVEMLGHRVLACLLQFCETDLSVRRQALHASYVA